MRRDKINALNETLQGMVGRGALVHIFVDHDCTPKPPSCVQPVGISSARVSSHFVGVLSWDGEGPQAERVLPWDEVDPVPSDMPRRVVFRLGTQTVLQVSGYASFEQEAVEIDQARTALAEYEGYRERARARVDRMVSDRERERRKARRVETVRRFKSGEEVAEQTFPQIPDSP